MTWFFAARLAWRQMCYDKMKTLTALLGVMFASVLVFMQMGFKEALFSSSSTLPRFLQGDLFVLHTLTEAIWKGTPFHGSSLYRLYGHPHVERIERCYSSLGFLKNPVNFKKRDIFILGYYPSACLIQGSCYDNLQEMLKKRGNFLFDRRSKPEVGPIELLLKEDHVTVEVNDRQQKIVGMFDMGVSFAASGNMITSEDTFFTLFPHRSPQYVDVGILKIDPTVSPDQVKKDLEAFLTPDIKILTGKELIKQEEDYWRKRTAIGFIFGMGVVIGLVVGMVIVYQILFTDVMNHLAEYATLCAIGYSRFYLAKVVISSSLWLAFLGFIPGLIASYGLYCITEAVILIPMILSLKKVFLIWSMIFAMCSFSSLLAIQKLKAANPADLF